MLHLDHTPKYSSNGQRRTQPDIDVDHPPSDRAPSQHEIPKDPSTKTPLACRYSGWASLVAMTAFIVKLYNNGTHSWTTFITTYWFWVTIVTIVLVALPWCWVAKVPVTAQIPASKRIALLRFPGNVTSGHYGRISRGSLTEWHVFGCFSESDSSADPHHFMICSAVGDFTKGLVEQPPAALYTRMIKFPGFSYCHRMYSSGVAICTGAAIGVFISLFSNKGLTNFSLIWVGSKFEATYGKQVFMIPLPAPTLPPPPHLSGSLDLTTNLKLSILTRVSDLSEVRYHIVLIISYPGLFSFEPGFKPGILSNRLTYTSKQLQL